MYEQDSFYNHTVITPHHPTGATTNCNGIKSVANMSYFPFFLGWVGEGGVASLLPLVPYGVKQFED